MTERPKRPTSSSPNVQCPAGLPPLGESGAGQTGRTDTIKTSRAPRGARREPGPVALLTEILADRPNLSGAACIGKWELYDAAHELGGRHLLGAARLCARCPVKARCPDRLDGHLASYAEEKGN